MAAFNFHRRKTRRWWYVGTTFVVAAFFAVFFVTSSSALNASPSNFEAGDGNMTLGTSGNTDWNCFQGANGFATLASQPAGCASTGNGAATNNSSPNPDFEQKPGQKFDTACPTFQAGNNPPKDTWSDVAQYLETSSTLNNDGGHDIYFYGASIRPVVNGNSSGNIYFSQGTNPAGTTCRTVGDVLLTFDFLGGGSNATLHILTWQGPGGSCYVGSDSPSNGCWGPSVPPTITGDNSDGKTNGSQIDGTDNGLNGATVLPNGFSEIGVNLTQAIKQAGGTSTCFANETWVSRSSGSSFTSSPEMVVIDSQPTCGQIKIIKQTNPRGLNAKFSFTSNLPANATAGGVACTTGGSAGVAANGNFCLNDSGNTGKTLGSTDPAQNSAGNTVSETQLPPSTYTVTESAPGTGFAYHGITCTPTGSATVNNTTRTATITLGISGSVVCVVQNDQQLGAIKITKTGKDKACTAANTPTITNGVCTGPATAKLNGATFSITGPNSYSNSVTTATDGTVCVQNLAFGSYTVTETGAPSGYGIDSSTGQSTTVGTNTSCSGSPNAVSASDTPLTNITATATSQATGGTSSSITCTGTSTDGNTTASGSGSGASASASDTGLHPGTYTCTIVIDP